MAKYRINNNIRKLRFFQNEMTQQQLADKVGVTRQTIIAMEQGKYSPSLELAFRVALAFGVPLDEVFSYDPEIEDQLNNPKSNFRSTHISIQEKIMKAIVYTEYGPPDVLQTQRSGKTCSRRQ